MHDADLRKPKIDVHVSVDIEEIPNWYCEVLKLALDDLKTQPGKVRRESFPLRDIPSNTGHDGVLDIGRTWMMDCDHNHECEGRNRTDDPGWYPRRLIDLTNRIRPRLLDTTLEKPSSRYATLSHCWGPNPQFLTLICDNLEEFLREIHLTGLPRSFQDAIYICSRLGIAYLWIDGLCILQDSYADWSLHTKEMSAVYSNCCVNLSFDMASRPEDGAFADRAPDLLQECYAISDWPQETDITTLEIGDGPAGVPSVVPIDLSETRRFTILASYDCTGTRHNEPAPLATRGWVLQERMLSPRILHFGWDRVSWECAVIGSSNEAFPNGIEDIRDTFSSIPFRPFDYAREDDQPRYDFEKPRHDPRTLFCCWSEVLHDYSCRCLSFPDKDKLVALAAIARKLSAVFGDNYYAGHFRLHMPFDLAWRVIGDTRPSRLGTQEALPDLELGKRRQGGLFWPSYGAYIHSRSF